MGVKRAPKGVESNANWLCIIKCGVYSKSWSQLITETECLSVKCWHLYILIVQLQLSNGNNNENFTILYMNRKICSCEEYSFSTYPRRGDCHQGKTLMIDILCVIWTSMLPNFNIWSRKLHTLLWMVLEKWRGEQLPMTPSNIKWFFAMYI